MRLWRAPKSSKEWPTGPLRSVEWAASPFAGPLKRGRLRRVLISRPAPLVSVQGSAAAARRAERVSRRLEGLSGSRAQGCSSVSPNPNGKSGGAEMASR